MCIYIFIETNLRTSDMKILVDVTKHKLVAHSKSDIMNKLRGGYHNSINVNSSYFSKAGHLIHPDKPIVDSQSVLLVKKKEGEFYRLYSLQKFKKKTQRTSRIITRGKRKGEVKKTTKIVRSHHWEAHYVDYPVSMVKDCIQHKYHYQVLLGI